MTDLPITRTFKDQDGVEVVFYEWPVAKPKAIVQIAHGLGEHARRWDDVAIRLNRQGYTVYADDHRGHGQTAAAQVAAGETKKLGDLGKGGLRSAFEQVHELTKLIRREHVQLPIVLLGHSYGSFISQYLIKQYSTDYAATVLTGSSLMTPLHLNMLPLNKKWSKEPGATGFEWLSREPEVGKKFAADHLTFYADPLKLWGFAEALRLFQTPKPTTRTDLPLLLMVGEDDPVGGPSSVKALADAYVKNGLDNVQLIVYNEARHEIFNELQKDEVFADLFAWLDAQLA